MTQTNPYAPPSSELDCVDDSAFPLHEPNTVGIGGGAMWLMAGFRYFRQSALQWVLTCIAGFMLMLVLGLLPLINVITMALTYVWVGGLMLGLKAQHDGKDFKIAYLFAGFKKNTGSLVLLSILLFVVMLAIMAITVGSFMFQVFASTANPDAMATSLLSGAFNFLLAMAIMIPVYMAFWFAPLLIVLHEVPIVKSLQMSFFGCMKNILPFLVYGILLLVIFVVGFIPLGLGLLVVMPVLFGSMFASYKEIFVD